MPNKYLIKTFEKNGVKIDYSPSRGGLITGIFINGKNILYFNEETFYGEGNVRGGIPVMFPISGPLIKTGRSEYEKYFGEMKQHGFARNSEFLSIETENGFILTLESNHETKKLYDFDFILEVACEITNNQINIFQKITNTGKKIMPISPGFHPYFYVLNEEKNGLEISCGNYFNDDFSFCSGNTISIKNTGDLVKIGNKISLYYGKEFNNIWIRSELGKDFVCVEPVYGDEGIIFEKPYLLNSGETKVFEIKILL